MLSHKCIDGERVNSMNAIRNPFTYRIPVIKLVIKELQSAKFYAILLVLVMLAGIFSLSPTIPSLMNDVTASLMNDVPPWSAANVTIRSNGIISTTKVTARSGSPEDIQAAVDAVAAAGGGTVYIPEGNFSFTIDSNKTGMSNFPIGVEILGGVNVVGAGMNKTWLIMSGDVDPSKRQASMFSCRGDQTPQKPITISGISFKGYIDYSAPAGDDNVGEIEYFSYTGIVMHGVKDFRVHDCYFEDFHGKGVGADNTRSAVSGKYVLRGVIDHCVFDNPYRDISGTVWGYGVGVSGEYDTWEEDIDNILGKYVNLSVFVEDCSFSRCRHSIASSSGAIWVFRHNHLTNHPSGGNSYIDSHGGPYSVRCSVAYNNIIDDSDGGNVGVGLRGSGGLIFNNTFINIYTGISLNNDAGTPEKRKCHDIWIWGNTFVDVEVTLSTDAETEENIDYFLYKKTDYTPYPYPHPLTLETTP